MKNLSLFWKIYLTLLLVLSLPMIVFRLADALSNTEAKNVKGPAGIKQGLEWNVRNLVVQADRLPDDALLPWMQNVQEESGLELYVTRDGRIYDEGDADRASPTKDAPSFPRGTLLASASSPSGRTEVSALLYPFGRSPLHRPLFRDTAMLAIALLGAGMSYLLVRNFMKPLVELRKATGRLAEGDFSVRVGESVTRRGDEIADLGGSFNWMAERVEKLIDSHQRLLADISHEIRSPLQRMDVALFLARENEGPDAANYLDRVELEVGRIDGMVEELLTLTRAESQSAACDSPVDMETVVRSIMEDAEFEGLRERKGIVATLKSLTVQGDDALLERAVGNVVHNAIRYTPPDTDVEIRLEEKNDDVLLFIRDCGGGVSEDELDKIFLPYYRTDKARERTRGGTGLGLAITKRIVENHGGSVEAFNSPQGGLSVKICLPIHRKTVR